MASASWKAVTILALATLFLAFTGKPLWAHSERVLYALQGAGDGAYPVGQLTSVGDTLYGVTESGGNTPNCEGCGYGTIFSVTGAGKHEVLYVFLGNDDGAMPIGGLVAIGGTLYGVTLSGGGMACPVCGTVFSLSPSGVKTTLHAFQGGNDGFAPSGGLINVNGMLYGVTEFGGGKGCPRTHGCGTLYSITPAGDVTILTRFGDAKRAPIYGEYPVGSLLAVRDALYGVTELGGAEDSGVLFRVKLSGRETVVFTFPQNGSNYPNGGLTYANGIFYGTTNGGGSDYGTVFSVTAATGQGSTLWSFLGGSDGGNPNGNLVFRQGQLYGTTHAGGNGSCGCGTAFAVDQSGQEVTLHEFTGAPDGGDGSSPAGGLILVHGKLFGSTLLGGEGNYGDGFGTLFQLKP